MKKEYNKLMLASDPQIICNMNEEEIEEINEAIASETGSELTDTEQSVIAELLKDEKPRLNTNPSSGNNPKGCPESPS